MKRHQKNSLIANSLILGGIVLGVLLPLACSDRKKLDGSERAIPEQSGEEDTSSRDDSSSSDEDLKEESSDKTTEEDIDSKEDSEEGGLLSCNGSGDITYKFLNEDELTTQEEKKIRDKIKKAMDEAIKRYNCYTSLTHELEVVYNPSVKTADATITGKVRFGAESSMNLATALHELGHTFGVGTSKKWSQLIKDKKYQGNHGNEAFREISGKEDGKLNGDQKHFWPYGLNQAKEYQEEEDLFNHCKIVEAMTKDLR